MLVAAAVCPHPPLLIPAACGAMAQRPAGAPSPDPAGTSSSGAAGPDRDGPPAPDLARSLPEEPDAVLREVRAACVAAVAGLLRAGPDLIVIVGGAAQTAAFGGSAAGSLAAYGIGFRTGPGDPVLPLSLTVGVWLVQAALAALAPESAGPADSGGLAAGSQRGPGDGDSDGAAASWPDPGPWEGAEQPGDFAVLPDGIRLRVQAIATPTPAAGCGRLGAELAAAAPRVALLAMGDASARKAAGVPGAADPAADRYDAEVEAALAAADLAALARLDPALDGELAVAGRAAWQALAGAAEGCQVRGSLRCSAAPYDVRYLVAYWECVPPAGLARAAAAAE